MPLLEGTTRELPGLLPAALVRAAVVQRGPGPAGERGLDKLKYGEVKISGVELSISWLVVRLIA